MSAEKLPNSVLGIIFGYVIQSDVAGKDICCWCDKPYIYIIRSPETTHIKLVCKKWMKAYKQNFILSGFFVRVFPWCIKYYEHQKAHEEYVKNRHRQIIGFPVLMIDQLKNKL